MTVRIRCKGQEPTSTPGKGLHVAMPGKSGSFRSLQFLWTTVLHRIHFTLASLDFRCRLAFQHNIDECEQPSTSSGFSTHNDWLSLFKASFSSMSSGALFDMLSLLSLTASLHWKIAIAILPTVEWKLQHSRWVRLSSKLSSTFVL
jgi:hypothetical protein